MTTQPKPTRALTQRQLVLAVLDDGDWHSTIEFVDEGVLRVSARVFELRCSGFAIETRRVGRPTGARYEYRLREPAAPAATGELDPDAELERIAGKFPDLFEDVGT